MFLKWVKNFPIRIATAQLFNSYRDARDNWIYNDVNFSLHDFGYKSHKDMSMYMKGDSKVNISNICTLCNWLISCEYVSLQESFKQKEIWQSPLFFEDERKGNCVASSLWAWRKLIELGFNVELFVGERVSKGDLKQHAWVIFEENENKVLIETVSKEKEKLLYSLDSVRQLYIPWASVDQAYKCKLYGGYCSAIKRENDWSF